MSQYNTLVIFHGKAVYKCDTIIAHHGECVRVTCRCRTISWWSNVCSQWMNEGIPWNWFPPWISTWVSKYRLLNSTLTEWGYYHSTFIFGFPSRTSCKMRKVLNFSPSTEVLTTFRSSAETPICSQNVLFLPTLQSPFRQNVLSAIYGKDLTCMRPPNASGQLNAVWSHCWSCLNEIRRVSRQAGLSWADRGSSISKWPGCWKWVGEPDWANTAHCGNRGRFASFPPSFDQRY